MQLLLPTTILGFLASAGSAKYGGKVFAKGPGECPDGLQSEAQADFVYAGGVFCGDISSVCADGTCGVMVTAARYTWGDPNWVPDEIGACADADCNDCTTRDLTDNEGDGFRYDCMPFDGQTYLLLNGPTD